MPDPVSHIYPWTQGAQYNSFGWKILVVWLTFGAFLNAMQLLLHFRIKALRKQPVCRVILWLSSVDFLFDFFCVLQCGLSLHNGHYAGTDLFCLLQGIWTEVLMPFSGISLAFVMLISYFAIIHNRVLTSWEIDKLHIAALCYCTVLAILGNIGPGHPTLTSAGLFCLTNTEMPIEGSLFQIGFIAPLLGTLTFFWFRINHRVKEMTQFLAKRKINAEARKGQRRVASRMAWYIYVFILCYTPYEISVWYSWITRNHPTYQMWLAAGLFAHILTVSNPILYYVLNHSARQIVYDYFFPEKGSKNSKGEDPDVASLSRRNKTGHNNMDFKLEKLVMALSNRDILNQMLAFADSLYCSEGILFWIDVQVWRSMLPEVFSPPSLFAPPTTTTTIATSSSSSVIVAPTSSTSSFIPANTTVSMVEEDGEEKSLNKHPSKYQPGVVRPIEELRQFACECFQTYFARGDIGGAPLALNIPQDMYLKIVEKLDVRVSNEIASCHFELGPEIRSVFDPAEKEILGLIYDNVYLPFSSKANLGEAIVTLAKVQDLEDGNLLPFAETHHDTEIPVDLTSLVLPRGEGGVSTGHRHFSTDHQKGEDMDSSSHQLMGISPTGAIVPLSPSKLMDPFSESHLDLSPYLSSSAHVGSSSALPSAANSRQNSPRKDSSPIPGIELPALASAI